MLNHKEMIGKPIVDATSGEQLAHVQNAIYDKLNNLVIGFLVEPKNPVEDTLVLPWDAAIEIKHDGISVASREAIMAASELPKVRQILEHHGNPLLGKNAVTNDQREIGVVTDFYFSPVDGRVETIEVSQNSITNPMSDPHNIPMLAVLEISEDDETLWVLPEAVEDIGDQPPGILETMRETIDTAKTKLTNAIETRL